MRPGPRCACAASLNPRSALNAKLRRSNIHAVTRGAARVASQIHAVGPQRKKIETLQHSCGLRRCACAASLNPTQSASNAKNETLQHSCGLPAALRVFSQPESTQSASNAK
jgi:hypothetical protein